MNKKQQPQKGQVYDADRDAALRKQQTEFIKEDIAMHKETDDPSPLEGAVEHIKRVAKDREEKATS